MMCGFSGCKSPAKWECRKLWGKGGTLHTCDAHKPDAAKRPEALRHQPFFYEVKPMCLPAPVGPLYAGGVTDAETARTFLRWCCDTIGLGFHPDVDFAEYVEADGSPVFTGATAARLDGLMAAAFSHLPDVYGECLRMPPFCDQK